MSERAGRSQRATRWNPTSSKISAAAAVVTVLLALGAAMRSCGADPQDRVHVRILVEPLVDDIWIVPFRAGGANRPPAPGQCDTNTLLARERWFASHGGALRGREAFMVEVVNDSDKTLVVDGIRLEKPKTLPRIEGVSHTMCPGEGGPFDMQYATVNLDARPRRFQYYDNAFRRIRAVQFAPEPHRPLRFYIQATAKSRRYQWTAMFVYYLDGTVHKTAIGNRAAPFDVTG